MPDPSQVIQEALAKARAGQHRQAIASLERLVQRKGAPAEASHVLGMLLSRAGRVEQAVYHLERACASAPGRPQFESNLANVLARHGRADDAEDRYRHAIETDEAYAPAHVGLSALMLQLGRLAEAEAAARVAVELAPANAEGVANLASSLIVTGRSSEAIPILERAIADHGPSVPHNTLLAAAMHYAPGVKPEDTLRAHQTLGHLHRAAARLFADTLPPLRRQGSSGRLRIGFLSADFRDHPVGMFIEPVLRSDERAEVFCYDVTPAPDEASARLRAHGATWREARALGEADLAALIRGDGLDALVELAGHTIGNRQTALAARLAPVQATYLGYPATTGNPGIDARLVDSRSDPEGAESRCTERLVRLDPCAWCFSEPHASPEVVPPPALRRGFVTFGSFNNLAKTGRPVIEAWAGLLERTPRSRLALKNAAFTDAAIRERLLGEFAERGIASDRLTMLPPTPDPAAHLAAYGEIDIALDTFPYAGTTTTCEAIWMGVPVVTLAGDVHAGRVGVSILGAVGLHEWIAPDAAAYARTAADLAADPDALSRIRTGLRERVRSSPLMDRDGFRARMLDALAALVADGSAA